jgi:DNA-3-methyladenine glycosylase II
VDRWAAATAALAAADPSLAGVIAAVGPCTLSRPRLPGGAFAALVRSICYQQLAGVAAASIHARVVALFAGRPTPEAVAAIRAEALAGAGLSGAKLASIKDLAAKVLDGTVPVQGWHRWDDEEIVERLTTVRGIGPWTAHMFLIFYLNRPDVWPVGDYGVRAGYAWMHGLAALPTVGELQALGDAYRPYRSIAAWYCWRAVERARRGESAG